MSEHLEIVGKQDGGRDPLWIILADGRRLAYCTRRGDAQRIVAALRAAGQPQRAAEVEGEPHGPDQA